MTEAPAPPERPRPAWRIGLVGPADGTLLRRLAIAVAGRLVAAKGGAPLLRFVTSLDDGAGVVVAGVAAALAADIRFKDLELRIEAILPCPGAEASSALAPGWDAVQAWAKGRPAGAVQALSLDGQDADERRKQRATDRMVMRNADTLVLLHAGDIHDTSRAAEILRFAARQGPSVLWHDAGTDWLVRDSADLHQAAEERRRGAPPTDGRAPSGTDAWAALDTELAAALTPPRPAAAHPHGMLEKLVHVACAHHRHDPYETYLAERGHRGGGLWSAYGLVRNRAARATGGWPPWMMPAAVTVFLTALALPFLVPAAHLGGARVGLLFVALVLGGLALGARFLGHASHTPAADARPWRRALGALGMTLWLGMLAALLVSPDSAIGEPVPVLALVAAPLLVLWLRRQTPHRPEPPQAAREEDRAAMYWWRAFKPADRLAIAYANRYRSAYVIVILMVALALIFAVLGLAFKNDKTVASLVLGAEALMLAGIVGFVSASIAGAWQERWVGYRLLAELCRKQEALSRLGWSLPIYDVRDASEAGLAGGAWIAWYFNALTRTAPLPGPAAALTTEVKEAIRARILGLAGQREDQASGLIQGQLDYHRGRKGKSATAAECWAMWGEFAFIVTAGCVGVKIVMKLADRHWEHEIWLAVLAAALPAVSAAFFALRAYSEEKLMGEQSRRMETDLAAAKRAMAAIPLDQPLSSQELAAETFEIAQRMLADITGWAQLVRVKVVEAG